MFTHAESVSREYRLGETVIRAVDDVSLTVGNGRSLFFAKVGAMELFGGFFGVVLRLADRASANLGDNHLPSQAKPARRENIACPLVAGTRCNRIRDHRQSYRRTIPRGARGAPQPR